VSVKAALWFPWCSKLEEKTKSMKRVIIPAIVLLAVGAGYLIILWTYSGGYKFISSREDGDEIIFTIKTGNRQIKASCISARNVCRDLALRTGQSIDCYLNPTEASRSPESYYDQPHPNYSTAGLVCHVNKGKGILLVVHRRDCADVRLVDEPGGVLHRTEDPGMIKHIGETYTSITLRCTNLSNCADDFKYNTFLELMGPEKSLKEIETFTDTKIIWQPAKRWVTKEVSDAELQRQFQDDLDSRKKDEPKKEQHFDANGIRLSEKLKDYYQDGTASRFCKELPDKYFNEHGKAVLNDDTIELDVHSIN
jgi:hypothetical protein